MSIELAFATRQLRTLCEEQDAAIAKFGEEVGLELLARLADLRAAQYVSDIVAGRPQMTVTDDPQLIIAVGDALEIVLRPPQSAMRSSEVFDWQHVRRLRVDDVRVRSGRRST